MESTSFVFQEKSIKLKEIVLNFFVVTLQRTKKKIFAKLSNRYKCCHCQWPTDTFRISAKHLLSELTGTISFVSIHNNFIEANRIHRNKNPSTLCDFCIFVIVTVDFNTVERKSKCSNTYAILVEEHVMETATHVIIIFEHDWNVRIYAVRRSRGKRNLTEISHFSLWL